MTTIENYRWLMENLEIAVLIAGPSLVVVGAIYLIVCRAERKRTVDPGTRHYGIHDNKWDIR